MNEKKPQYFSFVITHRCQSHCATCDGWRTPASARYDELSTNDWKYILSSLKEWVGDFKFIFSGGEPFLREDLFEIADYARDLGLTPTVITNGLALKNKCERLIDSGFKDITFSLNSIENPEVHNLSRGRQDAFSITKSVIENTVALNKLKNAGKKLIIATIIMPSSLTELVPLAKYAHELGVGIVYQMLEVEGSFFSSTELYNESLNMNDIMKEKTVDAISELINLKKSGYEIFNPEKQLLAFQESILSSGCNCGNSDKVISKSMIIEDFDPMFFGNENNGKINDKIIKDFLEQKINTPYTDLYPDKAAVETEASCTIGHYNFLIDPYGSVRACFQFDPLGSLLTTIPQNIWNSATAERIRHRIVSCNRSCKLLNCNYHERD